MVAAIRASGPRAASLTESRVDKKGKHIPSVDGEKGLLSPPLGSDIRVVSWLFRNTPYTMAIVQGVCSVLKNSVCLLTGCHVQMHASVALLRSHSCASGMYSCVYLHANIIIHLHTMHYTKYMFIFILCIIYKLRPTIGTSKAKGTSWPALYQSW